MSLTDAELVDALRNGTKIPVRYFRGSEVELFFEDEEELLCFADTIRAFLGLTEADRLKDTRHVYAYFKDFVDDVGFEWVEDGMERLTTETDEIWNFVYPTVLGAMESWDVGTRESLRKFAVLEGNCGWEQEHGILMSWRDGSELIKVSGYDGHATHGHAYDDLSKDRWIYHSLRQEMCTSGDTLAAVKQTGSRKLLSRIQGLWQQSTKDKQ